MIINLTVPTSESATSAWFEETAVDLGLTFKGSAGRVVVESTETLELDKEAATLALN